MTPVFRLGLFALGLALTFVIALGIGAAVGPVGNARTEGPHSSSHMEPR